MHVRNAILIAILVAFIAALCWGLGLLASSMEFSSFMIFCAVTFAVMVSCGYAWDWYAARRTNPPR